VRRDVRFVPKADIQGGDALALSPADFGKLIGDETEKWGNLIRTLNIKAECGRSAVDFP
jgi:hypothetical protein